MLPWTGDREDASDLYLSSFGHKSGSEMPCLWVSSGVLCAVYVNVPFKYIRSQMICGWKDQHGPPHLVIILTTGILAFCASCGLLM